MCHLSTWHRAEEYEIVRDICGSQKTNRIKKAWWTKYAMNEIAVQWLKQNSGFIMSSNLHGSFCTISIFTHIGKLYHLTYD